MKFFILFGCATIVSAGGIESWSYNSSPGSSTNPTPTSAIKDATTILTTVSQGYSGPNTVFKPKNLDAFVGAVGKGYAKYNPPYHNVLHGASVLQFCYMAVKTLGQAQVAIPKRDEMALLYACFGHDIEHPGRGNGFVKDAAGKTYKAKSGQMKPASTEAISKEFQGAGVLEQMHVARMLSILKDDKISPIAGMPNQDREYIYNMVKTVIMATDLAAHGNLLKEANEVFGPSFNPTALKSTTFYEKNKALLFRLIMSMADLSNVLRGVDASKQWNCKFMWEVEAENKERQKLGLEPGFLKKPQVASIEALSAFKVQELGFTTTGVRKTVEILARILNNPELVKSIDAYIKSINELQVQDLKACLLTPPPSL